MGVIYTDGRRELAELHEAIEAFRVRDRESPAGQFGGDHEGYCHDAE